MPRPIFTYLRRLTLLVLGAAALIVVVLLTPWGLNTTAQWVVSGISIFKGAELEVDRVEGNVFRRLTVHGLRLKKSDGTGLAEIPHAEVAYRIAPLLRRHVVLTDIRIDHPTFSMEQDSGGAWDLLNTIETDTTESAWTVDIDRFVVSGGAITAKSYAGDRDSTYSLRNIEIVAADFRTHEHLQVALERFQTIMYIPGRREPVELSGDGSISRESMKWSTLRLVSSESEVSGAGAIVFPGNDTTAVQNDFALTARPLSFNDIRLFAPWLAPHRKADILLEIEGPPRAMKGALHAVIDDGSTLEATAEYASSGDAQRSYRLDAELPTLHSGVFLTDALSPGTYSGQVRLNLAGPKTDRLSGTIEGFFVNRPADTARMQDSIRFDAAFQNGVARSRLFALIDEAPIRVEGSIEPFSDTPRYRLKGDVEQFDLARYTASHTSDVNAEILLEGRGIALDQIEGTAQLLLRPSRFNRYALNAGTLEVNLDKDRLRFQTAIEGRNGFVEANGRMTFPVPDVIDEVAGRFERFDLAAALGDTAQSAFSGSFEALGVALAGEEKKGALTLRLDRAEYGRYSVNEGRLEGEFEGSEFRFSTLGRLPAGSFDIDGSVNPFGDGLAYEITDGAFFELDIQPFVASSGQQSELNGHFSLRGRRTAPGTLHADGSITLTASQYNRQFIESADARFSFHGDTLSVDVAFDLPEGTNRFTGFVTETTSDPHYRITRGTFEDLDIGKIAGLPAFTTRLNGTIEGTGRGFDLATMETTAALQLNASSINDAVLHEGAARVRIDRRQAFIYTEMAIDEGRLRLEIEANNLSETPQYRIQGYVAGVDAGNLMGQGMAPSSINLSFDGEGEGLDPETMTAKGTVSSQQSTYEGISVDDLFLEFCLEDGLLAVDTLRIRSNVARIEGRGPVALYDDRGARPSDFTFETELFNVQPLAPFLGLDELRLQRGALSTRIYGRPGTLRYDSRATLAGLVYDNLHVGDLTSRFTGEFGRDRSLALAELRGEVTAVSIPGFVFENIDFDASYSGEDVFFEIDGRLDAQRNASVAGRLLAQADTQRVQFDRIDLKLDEDQWALDQPTVVEVGRRYRVRRFLIASGDQQIALDGVIDFDGEQNLLITIENFDVGTVADLIGYSGLSGPLNGFFDVQGPADAPLVMGEADLHVSSFGEEAGDLVVSLDYGNNRLNLDGSMQHVNGHAMQLAGYLPMTLALVSPETSGTGFSQKVADEGEVDLRLQADSMQINWILPFIDQAFVNRIDGLVTADVQLSGTASNPELRGAGHIEQGRLRSPFLGVSYTDISSTLALRDNVIEIISARVGSSDGALTGNGTIAFETLTQIDMDIDIAADRFYAIDTREYRGTASGNLKLAGSYTEPVLSGNVRVLSADMYLDETTDSGLAELNVQLTENDLLMLEREFGIRAGAADTTTFDLYDALSMDIDVLLERDIWVRSKKNPEMNVQLSGEVDVTKLPRQDHIVVGDIQVNPDRSYINQFGKRFDITLGTLKFSGPAADPELNFKATYEVPSRRSQDNAVTVNLDIKGHMEDLDLTLSSEPTMELTDMISYVVTGRPANEALQLGGSGQGALAGAGAGFALNQGVGLLTGAIETLFQESGLDLDVIQIEPLENAKGATITAGKYVTPRLFTAVSQPIGASDTDGSTRQAGTIITLEFELIDSLLLRLLGGESVMQINLLWHHAY